MKHFAVSWEEKVEKVVIIKADTPEEAMDIWRNGTWEYAPYVESDEVIESSVEVEVAE